MVGLPVFVLRERAVQEKLLAALTSECPIGLVYLQPIHRLLEKLVTAIVNAIASCNVHGFRVWLEGTDQGNLNWTNLDGPAKKRLLEKLPDTFAKVMPAEVEARVKPTWKAFRDANERISAPNDHAEVFHLCQELVRNLNEAYFCSARAL